MNYKNIFIICLIAILAAFVVYRFVSNISQNYKNITQLQSQNSLTTQTNSEGSVTVKVTPENISEDKKIWQFQIVLDTHTGSLDEDLTKSPVLIGDQEELQPAAWEGAPPGGHHREGLLTFESFSQTPKSVTLILRNVGGVAERSFSWSLKQ